MAQLIVIGGMICLKHGQHVGCGMFVCPDYVTDDVGLDVPDLWDWMANTHSKMTLKKTRWAEIFWYKTI